MQEKALLQKSGYRKVILGDDLGSERYLNLVTKFDFQDLPFLRDFKIRPFVFGEYTFYPPHDA